MAGGGGKGGGGEIIHIYSLIWQKLKQLPPSVSVTSGGYFSARRFAAR